MFAEFSCGGVILENNKVLLVQVKSMKGRKIWTFPKGHQEEGETDIETAIVKPLLKVRYAFTLKGRYVRKVVQWYLMKKLGRIGKHDPSEILAINWVSINKAKEMVEYPSDKRLLELVEEENTITTNLTETL